MTNEKTEGHSWANNECCQCEERGAVWNKHCNENREMSAPTPITWVCVCCSRYVCINCILTIPNSVPLEIYAPTYCSESCRETWLLKNKLTESAGDDPVYLV
jgi:hypothetical protein